MSKNLHQTKITDFSDSQSTSGSDSQSTSKVSLPEKRKKREMSMPRIFKRQKSNKESEDSDKMNEMKSSDQDERHDQERKELSDDEDSQALNKNPSVSHQDSHADDNSEGKFHETKEAEASAGHGSQQDEGSDGSTEAKHWKSSSEPNQDADEDEGFSINYPKDAEGDLKDEDEGFSINYPKDAEGDLKKTALQDLPKVDNTSNPCLLPELNYWDGQTTHHVLFRPSNRSSHFEWSNDHVRMPCDPKNEIVVFSKKGEKECKKRWEIIRKAFASPIKDVFQLQAAILSYNGHRSKMWDFKCLKEYFLKSKYANGQRNFFDKILPEIIDKAFSMEQLFFKSIPLLKKGQNSLITMTQDQAACLLANAFLCTFPWRSKGRKYGGNLPNINFDSLYNGIPKDTKLEKIKCTIHYLSRVVKSTHLSEKGNISFRRQVLLDLPDWESSKTRFKQLYASSEGIIEDQGKGMLQVDFANKYVGGGVLGHGCVQEEIRFMICPEMIVSRLFTEVLNDNEVLIMTGCERFSNYMGYSQTFEWTGNHVDPIERDLWGRKHTEVVAMDADVIKDKNLQYSKFKVDRELNKAYCAFKCNENYAENLPAVCTGNWGCGAFGGEKELKALIQLIAASEAGRDVCFLTFHDKKFANALNYIHSKIKRDDLQIGDIVKRIREFDRKRQYYNSTLFKRIKDLFV